MADGVGNHMPPRLIIIYHDLLSPLNTHQEISKHSSFIEFSCIRTSSSAFPRRFLFWLQVSYVRLYQYLTLLVAIHEFTKTLNIITHGKVLMLVGYVPKLLANMCGANTKRALKYILKPYIYKLLLVL